MRLFTCTMLGADNQAFYDEHVARLVDASGGCLRPIPGSSAHVTYAFLPKVSETELAQIVGAIDGIEPHPPISLLLGKPSVVYARKQPRLVCVKVLVGESVLIQLASAVVEALERAVPEGRLNAVRVLHVTLARFRRDALRKDGQAIESLLGGSPLSNDREETVSKIHVVESNLTPTGPVYTVRHAR